MRSITDALAMIRAIRAQGGAIRAWGGLLNLPQIIGGLIFLFTPEGAAIFLTVILTLVIAGQIHRRAPFSRLIGLCHLPWLVLLPWLVFRLFAVEHGAVVTLWLGYVSITIAISLVFDAMDVARCLRGECRFSWAP